MPTSSPSSHLSAYGIALLATAAAILVRAALTPWMGATFPLAMMFTAVAFMVWYGGWGPALFTAVAGYVAGGLFFNRATPLLRGEITTNELVSLTVYLLATGSIVVLGEAMRRAQRQLESKQHRLSSTNVALESQVEAQSLLAAIVSSSDDAIVSKTLEGRITSWNKGAERLFGYSAAEAVGQPIHLIVPPEGREQVAEILARIRSGQHIDHLETVRVRKDGARVNVSLTVSPVHDRHGRIIGASKTARDITPRKAWEAALVHSEQAQRLLVGLHDATRGLQDPALVMREIVTRVGQHFDASRCAYGDVSEELDQIIVNHAYARTGETHASHYPLTAFGPLLIGELRGGRTVIVADVTTDPLTQAPAAQAIYARMDIRSQVCVPLLRNRRLCALLVISDRVPRDWTADEARLLEQAGERTLYAVETARAVAALREADRRKDEFLATLAHELRNPLAPITSGLHILRTAGDQHGPAAAAREVMERQVTQLVRLVDDLLDVARITTGKVELRLAPIDLADAVRDAVETSRPLAEANGQTLEMSLPPAAVTVHADRTRLAQVFANLLNNSIKFSPRGQAIAIAVADADGQAVVRVRDRGTGITADALPKIFDMFRQADAGGRHGATGLGIGLSLVKRIAEMHGGTVEAHSDGPGRGSEFTIRIPLAERPAAVEPVSAPSPLAPVPRRRILVVDDNTDAAESLAALLSINGHETRLAHDGRQAVETARAFRPDMVFLDIGMPEWDGHETARRIRQEPWGAHMVLVALTGWGQVEDRRRSKEAGFNHHLVKPADPMVVAQLISSSLA